MSDIIKIRKGLNINLKGKAEKIFVRAEKAEFFAVKPSDFCGLTPKLTVEVEDTVKAGSVLFFDKYIPEIKFTSPVSGKVQAINRGERRSILEIVIKADNSIEYEPFIKTDPLALNREEIIGNILNSGLWPSIRQRPYNIIANPKDTPKSIFISAFDTAPLAPDYDFALKGLEREFQTGLNALLKLSGGKVHVNISCESPVATIFTKAQGVQINKFRGPHPTGNVGIQIHKIEPVNKSDVIWVIAPQDVIAIGRLFEKGLYDASRIIALTGSEVLRPKYYKTIAGTSIQPLITGNISEGDIRFISGNVLAGTRISKDGFLGYYDNQLTIIPEGKYHEFLGWAKPGFNKYSYSHAFFSWLFPGKEYKLDTNMHGAVRAFVMTGQYEKVLPMDIYPMQLLKAILAEDIERMEKLGIYEVAEEDFALCEYICTSKIEIQKIIRNGISLMIKETA
jgi:Na+-transporting NADH:ubiquinone oxidoreductase subunit A